MNTILNKMQYLVVMIAMLVFATSCSDDETTEPPVELPFASFTVNPDAENTMMVVTENTSLDADSYSWDFGDGGGTSTAENPTYTYGASGTYTITLTATNEGGSDELTQEVSVSGFGDNVVTAGDMSDPSAWTLTQAWTADDNVMDHAFENDAFVFKSGSTAGEPHQYGQYFFYQEVALTAGSTYHFSADVSSTSGTTATWFEVLFSTVQPVDDPSLDGQNVQLGIKAYGEGEDCTATPFEGGFLDIAKLCTAVNAFDQLINADGQFTVTADNLSENGTIFLLFRAGSGWAPAESVAGWGDGLVLDNVEIKEVL